MTLAQHIHTLRRARHWTLRDLAVRTELPLGTIHGVETGRVSDPQLRTIWRLADAFELTLDQLVLRTPRP